jgi:DnaJ-class molecular chaperone
MPDDFEVFGAGGQEPEIGRLEKAGDPGRCEPCRGEGVIRPNPRRYVNGEDVDADRFWPACKTCGGTGRRP